MTAHDPNLQEALRELISAARTKPSRWIVILPILTLLGSVWLLSRVFIWRRAPKQFPSPTQSLQ